MKVPSAVPPAFPASCCSASTSQGRQAPAKWLGNPRGRKGCPRSLQVPLPPRHLRHLPSPPRWASTLLPSQHVGRRLHGKGFSRHDTQCPCIIVVLLIHVHRPLSGILRRCRHLTIREDHLRASSAAASTSPSARATSANPTKCQGSVLAVKRGILRPPGQRGEAAGSRAEVDHGGSLTTEAVTTAGHARP